MRTLRNLLLVLTFLVAGSLTTPRTWPFQDNPAPVEYVIGVCGSSDFNNSHAVISVDKDGKKTITFDYYFESESNGIIATVKDPEPGIYEIVSEKKSKDGDLEFIAKGELPSGTKVDFGGVIYKDRITAIMFVNHHLGHVLYGHEGKVDDMIKDIPENVMICQDFRNSDMNDFPRMLTKYLVNKVGEIVPGDKN